MQRNDNQQSVFLVGYLLYWFSKSIMSGVVNNQVNIKDLLLILIYPLSTMWYIYALLLFWLIRAAVSKLKIPHELMIVFSFIICIGEYHNIFPECLNGTIIPRLMKNAVYYFLGITLADNNSNIKQSTKIASIISNVWVLLFSLRYYVNIQPFIGIYSILVAICGIVTVISISKRFALNFFTDIGMRSLGIYLLHDYFVCFAVIALSKLLNNVTVQILISFIIGTVGSYYLYKICIGNSKLSYVFQPQKMLRRK